MRDAFTSSAPIPVAIGGLGGSGARVFSANLINPKSIAHRDNDLSIFPDADVAAPAKVT